MGKIPLNLSGKITQFFSYDVIFNDFRMKLSSQVINIRSNNHTKFERYLTFLEISRMDKSEFIDRFKSIGCRFAIDDFGSGYSNFDHLLKLNIDTLKIDGTLIKNLPHDRNAQIFVKHICDFAHEMGISVVAEFVANEEIYRHVKEIGIDASQGYYFYEPSALTE